MAKYSKCHGADYHGVIAEATDQEAAELVAAAERKDAADLATKWAEERRRVALDAERVLFEHGLIAQTERTKYSKPKAAPAVKAIAWRVEIDEAKFAPYVEQMVRDHNKPPGRGRIDRGEVPRRGVDEEGQEAGADRLGPFRNEAP